MVLAGLVTDSSSSRGRVIAENTIADVCDIAARTQKATLIQNPSTAIGRVIFKNTIFNLHTLTPGIDSTSKIC